MATFSEEKYTLVGTASGYAVRRTNGDLAEFLGNNFTSAEDQADEAKRLLETGVRDENDYEWCEAN